MGSSIPEIFDTAIKALEENQKYKKLGTVEEVKAKLEELERWHITEINHGIKNDIYENQVTNSELTETEVRDFFDNKKNSIW